MLRHDPTAWPRKDHYAWFRALAFPWTAVTAELDATAALERAQAAGVGAFAALAHAASAAANAVPELRQRIRIEDGRDVVVEHAVVHAGLTLAGAGDLFTYAHVPFHRDLATFGAVGSGNSGR